MVQTHAIRKVSELSLFFRNDDVTELTPHLQEMTQLFLEWGVPLHHAVIPGRSTDGLAKWLLQLAESRPDLIGIDMHGWKHESYRGLPEFGAHVPEGIQKDYLILGQRWMVDRLGPFFSGVFVPPHGSYNRTTVSLLDQLGFKALSACARTDSLRSRIIGPIRYHLNRGELPSWNGRRFPRSRVLQCSTTFDPVIDYHSRRVLGNSEFLTMIGTDKPALQGICLHHWVFNDESRMEWVRTLLDEIRGRNILKMGDLLNR